jgi:hypothetical protein
LNDNLDGLSVVRAELNSPVARQAEVLVVKKTNIYLTEFARF